MAPLPMLQTLDCLPGEYILYIFQVKRGHSIMPGKILHTHRLIPDRQIFQADKFQAMILLAQRGILGPLPGILILQ